MYLVKERNFSATVSSVSQVLTVDISNERHDYATIEDRTESLGPRSKLDQVPAEQRLEISRIILDLQTNVKITLRWLRFQTTEGQDTLSKHFRSCIVHLGLYVQQSGHYATSLQSLLELSYFQSIA